MFRRDSYNYLRQWKGSSDRKPLIIRGARQVGKTTLVKMFSQEFETFIDLNLERKRDWEVFEKYDTAEEIIGDLLFRKNKPMVVKEGDNILLFIDEIQYSPKAVGMLRYFYEDTPNVHVIAAGSLLENMLSSQTISFPVGRVVYMALHPCSFTEFLRASGYEDLTYSLIEMELSKPAHSTLMQMFNEYTLIGGMPAVVSSYIEHRDLGLLGEIYESLIGSYQGDAEKYAKNETSQKVLRHILNTGWQYAGERIKLANFGESNYRSREVGEAFTALQKAFLLELVYPANDMRLPIHSDLKKSPKLFWLDVGLVNYKSDIQMEIFGAKDIADAFRGKVAEQIVWQELSSASHSILSEQHFWVREARNSQAEIDFLFRYNGLLIPIEVKSGHTAKLKSLHLFMETAPVDFAIRFWNNLPQEDKIQLPSGKEYTLFNLPYYYAGHLKKFLDKTL
ncbi:AAA family ATPase [Bacteroidales bacterium OttesenSCG-928-A17]|nr:AAA family ATPase [Bacteroidales bacterium OttesenSCG-928-A17]